jgi:uncharacterized membrane protein YkvA (DUF1232 family)
MSEFGQIVLGTAVSLMAVWAILVVVLVLAKPRSGILGEILRLLPDTVRLLRRLAMDPAVPRGARVRLWLLFAYLAMPVDLIPDFIPVIGHADDAIIVCLVLRSVARKAGAEALERNWPGTEQGLNALCRTASCPMGVRSSHPRAP